MNLISQSQSAISRRFPVFTYKKSLPSTCLSCGVHREDSMSENNEDALFKWHLQRLAQEDDNFFHAQCMQTITSVVQTRNEKLETAPPVLTMQEVKVVVRGIPEFDVVDVEKMLQKATPGQYIVYRPIMIARDSPATDNATSQLSDLHRLQFVSVCISYLGYDLQPSHNLVYYNLSAPHKWKVFIGWVTIHPAPWTQADPLELMRQNMLFPDMQALCETIPVLTEQIESDPAAQNPGTSGATWAQTSRDVNLVVKSTAADPDEVKRSGQIRTPLTDSEVQEVLHRIPMLNLMDVEKMLSQLHGDKAAPGKYIVYRSDKPLAHRVCKTDFVSDDFQPVVISHLGYDLQPSHNLVYYNLSAPHKWTVFIGWVTIHPAPWTEADPLELMRQNMLFPDMQALCETIPVLTEHIDMTHFDAVQATHFDVVQTSRDVNLVVKSTAADPDDLVVKSTAADPDDLVVKSTAADPDGVNHDELQSSDSSLVPEVQVQVSNLTEASEGDAIESLTSLDPEVPVSSLAEAGSQGDAIQSAGVQDVPVPLPSHAVSHHAPLTPEPYSLNPKP
jgi:hypothetical protein